MVGTAIHPNTQNIGISLHNHKFQHMDVDDDNYNGYLTSKIQCHLSHPDFKMVLTTMLDKNPPGSPQVQNRRYTPVQQEIPNMIQDGVKSVADSKNMHMLNFKPSSTTELKKALCLTRRYSRIKKMFKDKYKLDNQLCKSIEQLEINRVKTMLNKIMDNSNIVDQLNASSPDLDNPPDSSFCQ